MCGIMGENGGSVMSLFEEVEKEMSEVVSSLMEKINQMLVGGEKEEKEDAE